MPVRPLSNKKALGSPGPSSQSFLREKDSQKKPVKKRKKRVPSDAQHEDHEADLTSTAADAAVDILVEHRESGRSANWTSAPRITKRFTAIPSLGHRSGEAPLTVVVGREYRVSIDVATKADQFPLNDRKVFRFVGKATTDHDAKRSK